MYLDKSTADNNILKLTCNDDFNDCIINVAVYIEENKLLRINIVLEIIFKLMMAKALNLRLGFL